jgi:hypothetical protein
MILLLWWPSQPRAELGHELGQQMTAQAEMRRAR